MCIWKDQAVVILLALIKILLFISSTLIIISVIFFVLKALGFLYAAGLGVNSSQAKVGFALLEL